MAPFMTTSRRKPYASDETPRTNDSPAGRLRKLVMKLILNRRLKKSQAQKDAKSQKDPRRRNSAMGRMQEAQHLRAAAVAKLEKKYQEEILSECFTVTEKDESDRFDMSFNLPENDAAMEAQFMQKFRPYYARKGWVQDDRDMTRSEPFTISRPANS